MSNTANSNREIKDYVERLLIYLAKFRCFNCWNAGVNVAWPVVRWCGLKLHARCHVCVCYVARRMAPHATHSMFCL